jgi:hypothetical protein
MEASWKTKNRSAIWASNIIPRDTFIITKVPRTHVYCSITHNSQAIGTTKMPMNGLRKCGIYTVEFYSATKRNEILSFSGK